MGLMLIPELLWTAVFVILLVLGPILLCIISVLLFPFIGTWNRRAFAKVNMTLADLMWRLFVVLLESWGRSTAHFSGDLVPHRESAVIISNHNTIID